MNGIWRKLGLIYAPNTENERHPKLISHASNPLPILIDGDIYRVFFSGRDSKNRSSVGAVDIDIVKQTIIQEHYHPFFEHGPTGSFYADGVSIGSCYIVNGVRYMLFMGWQTPENSHWRGDIGRIIVHPDLSLELDGHAPLISSDENDPISLSYPWVVGDTRQGYRMWYGSTVTWDAGNGDMVHVLKHATSKDGHTWQRHGLAVPFQLGLAQVFSRPTVIGNNQVGFDMWFSYRNGTGQTYRIGRACSDDGLVWKLALDKAGIAVSTEGWDSEMIAYPYVFEHKGLHYMLYTGNGYGKSGFGLAVYE